MTVLRAYLLTMIMHKNKTKINQIYSYSDLWDQWLMPYIVIDIVDINIDAVINTDSAQQVMIYYSGTCRLSNEIWKPGWTKLPFSEKKLFKFNSIVQLQNTKYESYKLFWAQQLCPHSLSIYIKRAHGAFPQSPSLRIKSSTFETTWG